MDAATLVRVMDNPEAARYVDEVNQAMLLGGINTKNRAAGFLGVYIKEESVGMRAKQEYQNDQMWRYAPYIGRTFGQLTWESNYRAFGEWLHERGLLSDPNYFVNDPPALADDKWAVLGALFYWMKHGLNALADQANLYQLCQDINGGQNGRATRDANWHFIINNFSAEELLPEDDMTPDQVNALIDARMKSKWLPFITLRIRNAFRAHWFGGTYGVWTVKDAWNKKHKKPSIFHRKAK